VTSNCTDSVGIAKINYANKKDKTEEEAIEIPEEQETYPEVKVSIFLFLKSVWFITVINSYKCREKVIVKE
jgi:hypothetical protein